MARLMALGADARARMGREGRAGLLRRLSRDAVTLELRQLYDGYPSPSFADYTARIEPARPWRRWLRPSLAITGDYMIPEALPMSLGHGLLALEMAMNLQMALGHRRHLLIHAASSMAYRALRLLHLNDIALLCARMSESDWNELLNHGRAKGGPWWALPPLQLTAQYYDTAVPTEVLRALAASCPWTLRQLTRHQSLSDVSLSYPWIEAFPGIGWCRSVAEMLEYISSRVRPSPHVLQLRKVEAQTQIASSAGEWASLSQGRRMLKWITARQTRPDTLHVVRSAVAMP